MFAFHFLWLPVLAAVALSGCASSVGPLGGILSAVVSDKLGSGQGSAIPATPNRAYRYLRVDVAGRAPALLVLGYLDADPNGEVEVWYSAKGEVIKTQNGRIVGTVGLEVDWRALRYGSMLPAWPEIPPPGASYARSRDVFPGYHYGVSERVEVLPWPGMPDASLPPALPAKHASRYRWFRETATGAAHALPPAWFAWGVHQGQPTVVYSEQCLSASLCLKLLRWPLPEGAL